MGGLAPEGSLLEWIDEMFEGPRSPDQRSMGKWSNFKQSAYLIPKAVRERATVRVFAKGVGPGAECYRPDERCHPRSHGEFTDYSKKGPPSE